MEDMFTKFSLAIEDLLARMDGRDKEWKTLTYLGKWWILWKNGENEQIGYRTEGDDLKSIKMQIPCENPHVVILKTLKHFHLFCFTTFILMFL